MKTFALVLNTAYSDAPEQMTTAEVLGIYDTEDEARTQMADFENAIREDDVVFDTISSANAVCIEANNWTYYAKVMDFEQVVRRMFSTLNPDATSDELDKDVNFAFGIAACERDLMDVINETLDKKHLVPVFF